MLILFIHNVHQLKKLLSVANLKYYSICPSVCLLFCVFTFIQLLYFYLPLTLLFPSVQSPTPLHKIVIVKVFFSPLIFAFVQENQVCYGSNIGLAQWNRLLVSWVIRATWASWWTGWETGKRTERSQSLNVITRVSDYQDAFLSNFLPSGKKSNGSGKQAKYRNKQMK